MKKVLLGGLVTVIVLALIGGFGYILLFTNEDDAIFQDKPKEEEVERVNAAEQLPPSQTSQTKQKIRKNAKSQVDILNALDYETSKNRDTVGWLQVPGTDINNSVVQAHDNTTYLRLNERRQQDIYGCYFADYECSIGSRDKLSPNIVIYGHSDLKDNPDGPRFSQLFNFADPEFARNTPIIHFSTLNNFMDWQVFAVLYTELDFDFISANPPGGISKMAATAMERSLYDYGVEVGPQDHVLVLSTCTVKYGANDTSHRFVVMAKLLPEDASMPVVVDGITGSEEVTILDGNVQNQTADGTVTELA